MNRIEVLGPFDVPGFKPRHLRVYHPTRLDARPRPLLLMFDGQNVFDDAPSFAGGWHAHLAVERLAKNVRQPLVVGIDHGNEDRLHELSPFSTAKIAGRLDGFLQWVLGFVVPYLQRRFAVTTDRRQLTLGGSSLGGLAALYTHLTHPHAFGGVIAMSPSVWLGNRALLGAVRGPSSGRVYLDGGAFEAGGRVVADAQAVHDRLLDAGGRDLYFVVDPKGHHNERAWRKRLLRALRFQFGTARRPRA